MQRSEAIEALTNLILNTFRINGLLLANGEQRVKPYGLTSAQYQVLGAIGIQHSSITTPQIAKFIGITRQAVQKQLRSLQEKGLITFAANPYHERSPLYFLTEIGQRQYDILCSTHESLIGLMSEHFDLAELKTTLKVMEQFQTQLMAERQSLSTGAKEAQNVNKSDILL